MEDVVSATGAAGAILFPVEGKLPQLPHSHSMEPSLDVYVRDGWIKRDERDRIRPALERIGVGTDFDFTTDDEIKRHPYYQEFLAPHGLRWFAGVKIASGDDLWCLSIQRSIAQGPFSPTALRKLAVLSSHLSASAALARALGFARADAALSAFMVSDRAVVLLDRHSCVIRSNEAAIRLFGPDIQVRGRRLVSANHEATAALDRALHALLWQPDSTALLPPVLMPRTQGRPFLAYPLRLAEVSANLMAPCQAVVVIIDLERQPLPPENTLQISFGLTPAEAKLARHLVSGESIEAVATHLGIAYETARNQLKSVLAKTDTHRQAELVGLLTRIVARPFSPQ
ncbi:helix-turn-helix transcriptional regulator [Microvirga sp. VF16]|uniref:helix-turn-helix transcriptional regulator n=1 Tax=Microvirga sp. VF16 TaxID=2807101 RepID=UPI00193D1EA0|nr:helix-turn-helix transcriptional regulator [Microvirga sp. VF16]QRM35116.1 helix-turn-helix transcriptional regulator [Microvirga sp. VF16]